LHANSQMKDALSSFLDSYGEFYASWSMNKSLQFGQCWSSPDRCIKFCLAHKFRFPNPQYQDQIPNHGNTGWKESISVDLCRVVYPSYASPILASVHQVSAMIRQGWHGGQQMGSTLGGLAWQHRVCETRGWKGARLFGQQESFCRAVAMWSWGPKFSDP